MNSGSLMMSSLRMFPTTPLIKLGDNHFAKVIVACNFIIKYLKQYFYINYLKCVCGV